MSNGWTFAAVAQDWKAAREAMGRLLALLIAAEQCDLLISDGPRQALAAEGERLQRLAGLAEAEIERMAAELGRRPPLDCTRLRPALDGLAREAIEAARAVR